MSKRVSEFLIEKGSQEGELGKQMDIWNVHIFPIICQKEWANTNQWFNIGLVSKLWFDLVRNVEGHRIKIDRKFKKKYISLLATRFPKSATLETDASIGHLHIGMFKYLKNLTITAFDKPIYISIHCLSNLIILDVHRGVHIDGIEFLSKLEELHFMYLEIHTARNINLSENTNIKRLHLGKPHNKSTNNINLLNYIPPKSTLEYLECGDIHVFRDSRFTGVGKYQDSLCLYNACYEGEWFEGNRHGEGVFRYRLNIYSGIWDKDVLKNGKLVYCDGSCYEGDFNDVFYLDDNSQIGCIMYCHGMGKLVKHDGYSVYEGGFKHGMKHGKGLLWKGGILTRKGEWDLDVFIG